MATQIHDSFASAPLTVRMGRWFFKKRDFTPVPVLIIAALLAQPSVGTIAAGLLMMLLGDAVRIWGISYIGGASRTRSDGIPRLIRSGPFGRFRNPLYVGNFLMSTGAVIMTGLWWFVPAFFLLFAIQYQCIVLYEEFNLRLKFGASYIEYAKKVPRWLPLGPGSVDHENPIKPNLNAALKSERNTWVAVACTTGIFIAKLLMLPSESVYAFVLGLLGA